MHYTPSPYHRSQTALKQTKRNWGVVDKPLPSLHSTNDEWGALIRGVEERGECGMEFKYVKKVIGCIVIAVIFSQQ